jgi:hypothetical protein
VEFDQSSSYTGVSDNWLAAPGPRGPLAGGVPPANRGPGGELWGHHECQVLYLYRLVSPFYTG